MAQQVFSLSQSGNPHCPGHEATVNARILRKHLPQVFKAKARRTHIMTIFRPQRGQTGGHQAWWQPALIQTKWERQQMLGEGVNALPLPTGVAQTNTVSLSGKRLLTTRATAPAYAGSGSTAFTSKCQLAVQKPKVNWHNRMCNKILK